MLGVEPRHVVQRQADQGDRLEHEIGVIALRLGRRQALAQSMEIQRYRLAGCTLTSDELLPELMSFLAAEPFTASTSPIGGGSFRPEEGRPTYRGPGWIGNRWREVACWAGLAGYWLEIEGVGELSVSSKGRSVQLEGTEAGTTQAEVVEAVLGPGLILALAQQGTWCLHASAATFGGQVVAFAGESGNGKSTLAALLGQDGGAAWRRLVDDILPVAPGPDGPQALPHFPQLKLPPEAQPAVGQPERMPLRAIYVLKEPEAGLTSVEVEALSVQEATLSLVRHTVAARLFDRGLLARHMAFCAAVASAVPVRRLSYPRQVAWLARVGGALEADLGVPDAGP